jgi:hypothetical protein
MAICAAAVMTLVLLAVGCGGGSNDTHKATTSTGAPEEVGAPASFSSCPEARRSYAWGQEMIATAREGIEDGKEVQAARELLQTGKRMVNQSYEACGTERETSRLEGKLCRNTPQELAEALEIEDTPANREYIGVYEATCGRTVPLP